jgi:P-type conjugative transfer protein TrbJ
MRKTLLATVTAISLIVTMPTARAQFTVIDPANLVQNIQQVFQAIEEGIRTLRQIELAVQTVTGTDFAITPQLREQIQGVQTALNNGAAVVFEQTESLEQFRDRFPETFEAIDTLENLVVALQGQNRQLLNASQQAVQTQSVSAEAIEDILANVEASLGESVVAVGQTQAIQVGNQLQGQVVAMLAQIQASQLAAQRIDSLEAARRASQEEAAREYRERFHNAGEIDYGGAGYVPEGWPAQ